MVLCLYFSWEKLVFIVPSLKFPLASTQNIPFYFFYTEKEGQEKHAFRTRKHPPAILNDDGLIIVDKSTPKKCDGIRKRLHRLFGEFGFRLDIQTDLKIADYLDVSFKPI